MLKIFYTLLLTFIPIFIAVDAIGNIPLFISLVAGKTKRERHRIILDSVATATALAVIFMLVGKWILRLVGISIADFQIAGGALLFILSLRLIFPHGQKNLFSDSRDMDVGVFPLGTPLITGPAVLTTTLILRDNFGFVPTLVSVVANMLVTWIVFLNAGLVLRFFGEAGSRAISKVMYILLAAIGIMMIRKGIMALIVL